MQEETALEEEDYQEQEITFKLWHGTSKENAKMIIDNSEWKETEDNDKPFFGNGVYFMKDNKNLACLWSSKVKKFDPSCVILCFVKVKRKFVFDLAVDQCYKFYEKFASKLAKNFKLSSSIINAICESAEEKRLDIEPIKVVVGYYSLGLLNTNDNKISDECTNKAVKVQVQIAVRDQSLIKIKRIENCEKGC